MTERWLVFSGLVLVILLSWIYMLHMGWNVSRNGTEMTLACVSQWGRGDLVHHFIMWTVMMAAMMFPSATPMILMFTTVNGQRREDRGPLIPTGIFALGYFLIWTVYSGLASLIQWGLHLSALLTHDLVITRPLWGGLLLIAAGFFQWTPFRDACMSKCRSPVGFLMAEWREGRLGALIMGVKHGLNCVGCCWLLMLLSFVLGLMNLVWMAILTLFMLVEKAYPESQWVSRTAGLILVVWGVLVSLGAMS
ncbi:MAG: hypothetical protein C0407_08570 [Desulfobacca sp.]|nr:hypothetical protein [Desulfobacca sp.]